MKFKFKLEVDDGTVTRRVELPETDMSLEEFKRALIDGADELERTRLVHRIEVRGRDLLDEMEKYL